MREDIIKAVTTFISKYCLVSVDKMNNVVIHTNKPEYLFLPVWNELTTEEQFDILHKFISGNIHSVRLKM